MSAVAMPQLGESVSEGTVVRWLKRVGEPIAVDEPLFEVATDKVNTEIPSLDAGVVREILVPEGATVAVGTVLARIDSAGDASADAPNVTTGFVSTADSAAANGAAERIAAANGASSEGAAANGAGSRAHLYSPAVRRLAREHAIDLKQLSGSGAGGRVTRADVLAHVASATSVAAPAAPELTGAPHLFAADTVHPDLVAAPAAATAGGAVPFSPMRARIAENLIASKRTVADVFSAIEVDMENVHAAREAQREAFRATAGTSLTYLPFVAVAVVEALRAFPAVNARIDGTSLVHNDAVHLGIAVDLDGQGLVVPVVRDADGLNVTGMARAIAAAADGARGRTLPASAYAGSTFSITNNGSFGTLMTAPIVNLPNVATLSTDAVEERVVPWQGMIAIRKRMYLCMSWDHRAFDGSTAGRFLAHVKRTLESPAR